MLVINTASESEKIGRRVDLLHERFGSIEKKITNINTTLSMFIFHTWIAANFREKNLSVKHIRISQYL
jgi:hypothetical protein